MIRVLRRFLIRHKPLQIAVVATGFLVLTGFLLQFQCRPLFIPRECAEVMGLTKAPPLKPLAKPEGVIVSGFVFYGRKSRVSSMQCYIERNLVDNGGWLDEVLWIHGKYYIKINDDILWIDDNAIPNLVTRTIDHPEDFVVAGNIINNPPLGFMHFRMGALHPYFPELEQPSYVTSGTDYWKPSRHGFWDGPKNFT
ncbi:Hypothetical protein NCS54_00452900 [Fusarium falciforme]|uniref:Hypothetical protein n=1 Tax=Fusarium falciforme TaxID=195108 RepID=UPI00230169F6|nr:Hypothetical protein NCS54_00452900 [Fusarium falciforme]WAO87225.1 Hypothetical protein NCS54_00452900 [Fusarium falciforme]